MRQTGAVLSAKKQTPSRHYKTIPRRVNGRFKAYGEKELGYQENYIHKLVNAAEISLQIGFSKILEKQPTESHLVPLKQVPEKERKAIWEEATRKAEEEHAKPIG